ncbi:uncharacterized SAM-binding protein YcdF (DUF218 family) [Tamaricihabitans halophyticus]|uniref:Uncharacterized SAM-binding protein YcdF (DUF218 family) n=1 Tax=Tamaricihabitans halophyticus TaxID=1262583 RepID=A0A4R2Q3K1_9PSEU|nr:YdcF family protein [Tamaricihabitans halophyticus]TCP41225.1 uncharacterized SAM-binding protein YcdF (DUF218 family) [Tamaricihabitans halophyticus]
MTISPVPFVIAGLFLLVFLVSFGRDQRKLRNGFYLFFALVFLAMGVLFVVASVSGAAAAFLLFVGVALASLSILAVAVFLICNGITMLRREGRRPANLLSLLAGIAMAAFVPVNFLIGRIGWKPLWVTSSAVNSVLAYMSLLFICFLLYVFVYGRIRIRHAVDFIVVLGAGLLEGKRVSPLLASRLDRGHRVFDAETAKGRNPVLITSGGQGADEAIPEAEAMANYLTSNGVSQDNILLEQQSQTTWENLTYSKELMRTHQADYRCVIVTNNFHVLRAALLARKAKVNGHVIGSPTAWYFWPSATIREFIAIFLEHRTANITICVLIVALQVATAIW